MREPDVLVTVEGGVAQVDVKRSGIVVEVRDYDLNDEDEDDECIWKDQNGDRCWRYFVDSEKET